MLPNAKIKAIMLPPFQINLCKRSPAKLRQSRGIVKDIPLRPLHRHGCTFARSIKKIFSFSIHPTNP